MDSNHRSRHGETPLGRAIWFPDDATIRNCAWIAAIAGVSFVIRSLTFARPVVDLRALKNRNFAVGCLLSFVTGIGIFSTIYLTPLFLGYVRGFSAWQTGTAKPSMTIEVPSVCFVMLRSRKSRRRAASSLSGPHRYRPIPEPAILR